MEGKASEKLEELGKKYLDNLINNFDSKSFSQNKGQKPNLKNLNKKNFLFLIIHA